MFRLLPSRLALFLQSGHHLHHSVPLLLADYSEVKVLFLSRQRPMPPEGSHSGRLLKLASFPAPASAEIKAGSPCRFLLFRLRQRVAV